MVRFGAFTFDSAKRQLTRGGADMHVTPKAFDLLALLVDEAPRVVTKRELHERLWPDTFVSDATLIGLVKELRRALDDRDPDAPVIRTVHRVGYAFGLELEGALPDASGEWHWIVNGGRRIHLREGENLIGRDPAAEVWLDAAGVSRRHARILVRPSGALLEDLGSKNGTRLRDVPVTDPVALGDGDRIHVGSILVTYRRSRSGVSTETQVDPGAGARKGHVG